VFQRIQGHAVLADDKTRILAGLDMHPHPIPGRMRLYIYTRGSNEMK
jgi:hypothetical protein